MFVCVREREKEREMATEGGGGRESGDAAAAAVGQSVLTRADMKFSKLKGASHTRPHCSFVL
jgi:hypothetical protein